MDECGAILSFCKCRRTDEHEDHRCDCQGSWRDDGTILSFPRGSNDPIDAIVGLLYEDEED